MNKTAPLNDSILVAVYKLIDDGQTEKRAPTHSELESAIHAAGLAAADPRGNGPPIGKAKRIRAVLYWAIENDLSAGENLVSRLIALVGGCGGFREASPNFVGRDAIETLRSAFRQEGYDLGWDGSLWPVILDSLSGTALTDALWAYVRRARRGVTDAALVTGTGKDLLEATAAHVLVVKWGSYPTHSNFPILLGQAFTALHFATPAAPPSPSDTPQQRLERALYDTACTINTLRNKEGTGHGRPWLPTVTDAHARTAVEIMGCIAEMMLAAL